MSVTRATLVTTGCNIPIFVAAHKEMHLIPIAPPTQLFKWINFYDPDDVLGCPLQPLSNGYRALVEQAAAAAASMQEQAARLAEVAAAFRLGQTEAGAIERPRVTARKTPALAM